MTGQTPTEQTEHEVQFIAKSGLVLSTLGTIIHRRMTESGFWVRRQKIMDALKSTPGLDAGEAERLILMEGIALIASELGEATEGVRKNAADDHCPQFSSVSVELADAIIRILDLSHGMGLQVPAAIIAKMEYNRSRPKMHGKLS